MSKSTMPSFLAFALMTLGLKELPVDDKGAFAPNEDQDAKLAAEFGGNYEAFKKKANDYLAAEAGKDAEKVAARQKANAELEAAMAEPENDDAGTGDEKPAEATNTLEANAEAAAQVIKDQRKQITVMGTQPEPDEVVRKLQAGAKAFGIAAMIAATSSVSLFGMDAHKEFSMDNPWNKRASLELAGKTATATDFTDTTNIARLNEDLKEYYVRNPQVLRELKKDTFGLPDFWPKVFNVVDQLSDAVIDVANVTQGRKPEWSPNPDFFIQAEKRKNYPVQIDIQFTGYQLQRLETSWINKLISMDGSSPYKLSFVAYLVQLIDKQARLEDRISSINGVYVFKPEGIKAKGSYLNRQNGLRAQLFKFRDIEKKILAFKSKLGPLTIVNAYDYFKEFAEWLSADVRKQLGLKIYVGQHILNGYQGGFKVANGLNNDYTGNDLTHIEGYSNLEFVVLNDLEGWNGFFMTDENNIEILEDVPNEKSIYRFEQLKRDTFIHADYKQTAAFVFAGFKLPADSKFLGQAQMIWMNDAPIFNENFDVPMYGDLNTSAVDVNFTRVRTDRNLLANVHTFNSELTPGQFVKIIGNVNQLTSAKILKKTSGNGGNLDLTADFDPKSGGSLTLLRTVTGFKEITRTSEPEATPSDAFEFTTDTIDSNESGVFHYKGDAAKELKAVLNGVEGTEVKIFGQADNTITVDNVDGNILVTNGEAVLAEGQFIVLKKFDGIWVETSRG